MLLPRMTSRCFLTLLTSSALISLADSLSGEHVCTRVENVTLSRRETYEEPVVVHTFTWCLQVPPRCPKTRIEIRERYRIKTTVKQRVVTECCQGYILQESSVDSESAIRECVPLCKSSCRNGVCTAPDVCLCNPGFQGSSCAYDPSATTRLYVTSKGSDSTTAIANKRTLRELVSRSTGLSSVISSIAQLRESETVQRISNDGLTNKPELSTAVQFSNLRETTEAKVDYDESWTLESMSENRITKFSRTMKHVEKESTTVGQVPEETDVVAKSEYPTTRASFEHELTPFEETIRMVSERTLPNERTDEELDYRNYATEESRDMSSTVTPERSYVKRVQKGNDAQIQNDLTVIIVVGCIASLCLTTLAALTVFYLRCKLFDSIPIAIYSTEKNEPKDDRRRDATRNLKITDTTLPPLPTFVNPVFTGSQETALITFDAAELNKHYDNGTATISIRVSGNIRDLLESHYDRPPTATCRHTVDQNTEHVYDEIPLTAPLCVRKES